MELLLDKAINIIWGPATLALVFFSGLYLTVKSGFFPFRHPILIIKKTFFSGAGKKEGVSPFEALSTALSGSIGVGNIVGVAAAIAAGGPGAVFWMWVSASVGMMIKFSEVSLAMRYREKAADGSLHGGPMHYLKYGLGSPLLAGVYAAVGFCSAILMGGLVQSNTISAALEDTFNISKPMTAALLTVFLLLLFAGGSRRVFRFSSFFMPFMTVLYTAACVAIISLNLPRLPEAVFSIFKCAFGINAAAAGGCGYAVSAAIRNGFSKSVFSNEAGMGTSSIPHSASSERVPEVQAMWGIIEVFIDTMLICTLTALVLLTGSDGSYGMGAVLSVFSGVLGKPGAVLLTLSIVFFAISTIAALSFYGKEYYDFFSKKKRGAAYTLIFILCTAAGTVLPAKGAWGVCEIFNGLALFFNLSGLLLMSSIVIKGLRQYLEREGKRLPLKAERPKTLAAFGFKKARRKKTASLSRFTL